MGTLRLLLALAVVANHSGCFGGSYCLMRGGLAVQLFYVISGLLIALILHEKYDRSKTWLFYSNRALRIYVPYLFVWTLCLAAIIPFKHVFGSYPGYAGSLISAAPQFD